MKYLFKSFLLLFIIISHNSLILMAETLSEKYTIAQLTDKAISGSAEAQFLLGEKYRKGIGIVANVNIAAEWYQKAASQKYAAAQFELGCLYATGEGVQKNHMKSASWFRKAAEQGHAVAQFRLASCYAEGKGVRKDQAQAIKWYQKSGTQGDVKICHALGNLYKFGIFVSIDYKEAFRWFSKAAEQGDVSSEKELGSIYYSGRGVAKDMKLAAQWFRKAAEQGNAFSQFSLGLMYTKGHGVLKNEIEGLAWVYLARSNESNKLYEEYINMAEEKLRRSEMLAAQQRAREIEKRIKAQSSNAGSQSQGTNTNPSASVEMLSRGSGVFVSKDGLILTAAHVLEGASSIKVQTQQGLIPATVVQIDATNDVALLRCKGQFTALHVVNSRNIRLGRGVFTIGFPQVDLQGFSPKLTKGEISSLAGMRDDPRHWQISAPIQPGNSGGPLFDENGDIVGIVISKLDEISVAAQTGNLSQNVNYALKSAYIRPMLEEHDIAVGIPKDDQSVRLEDIAERVQKSVVLIVTYKKR